MITINLASPIGGSGRTSVALNLAQSLCDSGRDVFLIQADPINTLNFQVGIETMPARGLAQCLQTEAELHDVVIELETGLKFIPFGQTEQKEFHALTTLMINSRDYLMRALRNELIQEKTVLVVDLPRWPNAWCDRFMEISDLNLITLTPDSNSILSTTLMLESLLKSRGASYFLMNRFESTHVLHLDLWTLCKIKLSHRLLPFYLHQDQALPESFASGTLLKDYAPGSQLTEDLQKLANWIDLELG